jgi:hypothetical protein
MYPEENVGEIKSIGLINSNPAPLAGVLAIGYFMHPLVIPVIRRTSVEKNYERDVSYGYTLIFLSYFLVGLFGFFGFQGNYFNEFAKMARV